MTMDQKTDFSVLPEQIRRAIEMFCQRLADRIGDRLESITVVGSSLTNDYLAGKSDINTVLVLAGKQLEVLEDLAGLARKFRRKRIAAPLLMTAGYIDRSRDVFGIELLDLQLNHRTILGQDPFADLQFEKVHVRLQCERELKATLIRLRQSYIAAGGNRSLVRDVLASAAGNLAPLLRAMLWLQDKNRPITAGQTLKAATDAFAVDTAALCRAIAWRHSRPRISAAHTSQTLNSIYQAVDKLAEIVDGMEP